jgi:hypothetical protein
VLDLARAAAGTLMPLDALLAGSLVPGHHPGQPLVLTGAGGMVGGGLVAADREGLIPIAWVDEVEQLLPWWRACGSPTVLVGPTAVQRQVVEELQDAGVGFVIGVPPTQREHWRRLPPPLRLWTNHTGPLGLLAGQAAGFAAVVERLDELVDTLGGRGRAGPRTPHPGLDRSLALAAALGLGTIAWTLWRDREPTDPLLALDRFGDLGARVQIDATRVRVRLPLGRRHDDLLEHGLLADVPGAPWLAGRVVEFAGG